MPIGPDDVRRTEQFGLGSIIFEPRPHCSARRTSSGPNGVSVFFLKMFQCMTKLKCVQETGKLGCEMRIRDGLEVA